MDDMSRAEAASGLMAREKAVTLSIWLFIGLLKFCLYFKCSGKPVKNSNFGECYYIFVGIYTNDDLLYYLFLF